MLAWRGGFAGGDAGVREPQLDLQVHELSGCTMSHEGLGTNLHGGSRSWKLQRTSGWSCTASSDFTVTFLGFAPNASPEAANNLGKDSFSKQPNARVG